LCFQGPEERLTLTEHAQPAILTTSVAALEALRERLPGLAEPACAAGHSLGEYSALVASGALSLEDAVRLVRLRGEAMQRAVPEGEGAMAAILGGDVDAVTQLCAAAAEGDVVSPANYNAPGQVVIAGTREAVARAMRLASESKLKAIPLKVSAPFHSSLMAPATRAVQAALSSIAVSPPRFPIFHNVDGEKNTDASQIADRLVRQIESPVRWEQTVRRMAAEGMERALEIGPGNVLSGLLKRIDKNVRVLSVSAPESLEKVEAFLA
jgi:[acyl-carrier-protein] S-malonyltransferase